MHVTKATVMENRYGVLIDVTSIQDYIYGSNRLRENIGASYIVAHVLYEQIMVDVLEEVCHLSGPSKERICNEIRGDFSRNANETISVSVGYVGGGNALLFFHQEDEAVQFVEQLSLALLTKFPGIRMAYALHLFNCREFQDSKQAIFERLMTNKNRDLSVITYPKPGIVEECPQTGEVAERICQDKNGQPIACKDKDGRFISSIAKMKEEYAADAQDEISKQFQQILQTDYVFTDDIEKLGQSKEENNYMAVIHIDGNNMGDRFAQCSTIEQTRNLSRALYHANLNAFEKMLQHVVALIKRGELDEEIKLQKEGARAIILPIRPILIGGDDITFVSAGKLGVYLAKYFIEQLEQATLPEHQAPITACAGISIGKTRYPFFRSYQIADRLLQRAKERSREHNASYVDFFIAEAGFSSDLDIVNTTNAFEGPLHAGPYCVGSQCQGSPDDFYAFTHIEQTMKMVGKRDDKVGHTAPSAWPSVVQKSFRDKLLAPVQEINDYFSKTNQHQKFLVGRELPLYTVPGQWNGIWEDAPEGGKKLTLYFDSLTLNRFYPLHLIPEQQTEAHR